MFNLDTTTIQGFIEDTDSMINVPDGYDARNPYMIASSLHVESWPHQYEIETQLRVLNLPVNHWKRIQNSTRHWAIYLRRTLLFLDIHS